MKKTILALTAFSSLMNAAQADSGVTIYGAFDIGIVKVQGQTVTMGRGDNNKLGFMGQEDLGNGLSALFKLEMRFEPDTGTSESSPNRPMFQGESRVGLKGGFGTIRLGRGLSAIQDDDGIRRYEPWHGASNCANLGAFALAAYNSDPLSPGSSQNRFSNALFYNSPILGPGFQFNASVATKEALTSGTPSVIPLSMTGTYNHGDFSGMIGFERNAINTEVKSIAGSYSIKDLVLMASISEQKFDATQAKIKGFVLGGNYKVRTGTILAGYGRNRPDGTDYTDQLSVGYEHTLSKRTFLYIDGWHRRAPGVSSIHAIDVGIHHNF